MKLCIQEQGQSIVIALQLSQGISGVLRDLMLG